MSTIYAQTRSIQLTSPRFVSCSPITQSRPHADSRPIATRATWPCVGVQRRRAVDCAWRGIRWPPRPGRLLHEVPAAEATCSRCGFRRGHQRIAGRGAFDQLQASAAPDLLEAGQPARPAGGRRIQRRGVYCLLGLAGHRRTDLGRQGSTQDHANDPRPPTRRSLTKCSRPTTKCVPYGAAAASPSISRRVPRWPGQPV